MRRSAFQTLGLASSLILFALVVSGCFQASGAGLPPTQTSNAPISSTIDVAALNQQATFLALTQIAMLPTTSVPTDVPTAGTPSDTPLPLTPTNTDTPLPPSPTNTDTPIPPSPTNTATPLPPSPTLTATPTIKPNALVLPSKTPSQPTALANLPTLAPAQSVQQDQTQAAIFAQATNIIQTVTQAAANDATGTALALGTGVVNPAQPTPIPPINPTPVPGQGDTTNPLVTPGPGDGTTGNITPDGFYTVAPGDRLFRIGLRFNMTYQYLAQVNGIVNPNLILPGEVLKIPGYNGTGLTSTPVAGNPTATPGGVPNPNSGQTYIVQYGDTLFSISLRYGTTVTALAQNNGITNINLIYIGQKIVIP